MHVVCHQKAEKLSSFTTHRLSCIELEMSHALKHAHACRGLGRVLYLLVK